MTPRRRLSGGASATVAVIASAVVSAATVLLEAGGAEVPLSAVVALAVGLANRRGTLLATRQASAGLRRVHLAATPPPPPAGVALHGRGGGAPPRRRPRRGGDGAASPQHAVYDRRGDQGGGSRRLPAAAAAARSGRGGGAGCRRVRQWRRPSRPRPRPPPLVRRRRRLHHPRRGGGGERWSLVGRGWAARSAGGRTTTTWVSRSWPQLRLSRAPLSLPPPSRSPTTDCRGGWSSCGAAPPQPPTVRRGHDARPRTRSRAWPKCISLHLSMLLSRCQ